jgi:aerobic-type carbon monoxide dehydrogenase small subunit (CoxS/CutS family)
MSPRTPNVSLPPGQTIEITINGKRRSVENAPWRRLLDVLRVDLGLTGTKEGCGEGECGACTVLIDGEVANSCLVAVGQVDRRTITTIEGLAAGDVLSDVQAALVRFGGTQCGICTPGIALTASRVLEAEPDADRARLRELMAGNLCRCTGYQLIVDALIDCAATRRSR